VESSINVSSIGLPTQRLDATSLLARP